MLLDGAKPRRDRLWVLASLIGVTALCWVYLVRTARDMYGAMDGPSAWMMTGAWDAPYFTLMFLMWAVMMAGMMLPSATPAILLYGAVLRKSEPQGATLQRSYAFVLGYVLVWSGFSLCATLLQWALSRASLLSPMMVSTRPALGALILVAAGVYQWTPLKRACLTLCRSPVEFISRHWSKGLSGALGMGLRHGLYCVGCCWALMLLLFFGGVMSLAWIAAITFFVLLEKLAPYGEWSARVGGALLVTAGLWVFWSG
jgi:predicted metal-binding membrane protein